MGWDDLVDSILITASVVTALTVITAFLFKIYNFFRKLEKKYDEMNALLKDNTIHLLKIAVLDEKLYFYTINENSISHKPINPKQIFDYYLNQKLFDVQKLNL